MPTASVAAFNGGLVNKPAPHLLADDQAVVCENCIIDTGAIVPLAGTLSVATAGTTNLSIYKFGADWQTHTAERWYAEAGAVLYWADGGVPQKKNAAGTQVRIGIVAPATSPAEGALTKTGTAKIVGTGNPSVISYVVTFYSDPLLTGGWGGESANCVAIEVGDLQATHFSSAVTPDFTDLQIAITAGSLSATGGTLQIGDEFITYTGSTLILDLPSYDVYQLTGVTRGAYGSGAVFHGGNEVVREAYSAIGLTGVPVSADPQVNARRIWRLVAGEYRLAGQINDNTTTTYSDAATDADLGGVDILTTDDNDTPPALTGICGPYNGMMFGWLGDTVYWSKVGKYDAWPADGGQQFEFGSDVTSCAVFGNYVVVLCPDGLYTLFGDDPAQMSRSKALTKQGCVAGRTAVDAGRYLLYLSPDGVCAFDGAYSLVISDPKLSKATFSALSSPFGAFHDGHYHLFHSTGSIIGDFRGADPVWRTSTVTAASAWRSDEDDALYLGQTGEIHEWGAGAPLDWRYWTGELSVGSLTATKIFHTLVAHHEGTVRCEFYVDGGREHDETVYGDRAAQRMRLSEEARGYRPQLRLSGSGTLYAIEFEYSGPGRAR